MYESHGKLLTALEKRRYIAVSRNDPHFIFIKKRKTRKREKEKGDEYCNMIPEVEFFKQDIKLSKI